MKVIVAGAGIVGLTTAAALRQMGAEVVVVEKADRVRAAGAAIGLWPNALDVFDEFDLGREVKMLGEPIDTWFFTAAGERFRAEGFGPKDHQFILVPRPALNEALARAVGHERIHLDARVVSFEEREEGITVALSDGATLEADLLVGADGVYSDVRQNLLPGYVAQHHQGHHAWRGLLPSGLEPDAGTVLTVGHERTRGGYARTTGGQVMWMVNQFDSAEPSKDVKTEALLRAKHLNDGGWGEPLIRLIEATPDEAILHNPIMFVPQLPKWTSKRVALIGDAAHGLSPHIAAGGTLGIEDIRVLVRALKSDRGMTEALLAYESNRIPHYEIVQNHSREVERASDARTYADLYARFSHWMLNEGADTARNFF